MSDQTLHEDLLDLLEEDKERYVNIRKLTWLELERRLEERPGEIPDVQLVRLMLETAKLDLARREENPAPRNQTNNILAIALSAESLPPERRREVLEALTSDRLAIEQAMELLNEGETE